MTPPKRTNTGDPGAHELESSESEDHFSDAQSAAPESNRGSPLPKLRVEKVSNEPSYGEVPGTEAYKKREGDAAPDEIAVIPDTPAYEPVCGAAELRSPTPGGQPIPRTVLEETADSAGSVSHPEKHHESDPEPDEVLKAVEKSKDDGDAAADTPITPSIPSPSTDRAPEKPIEKMSTTSRPPSPAGLEPSDESPEAQADGDYADDDFGDDFDDFEEGGGGGEDDFGDFDDGFQEPRPPPKTAAPPPAAVAPPQQYTPSFPIPDFEGMDASEVMSATEPYLNAIYPPEDEEITVVHSFPKDNPIFQTPRSASLWAQLVAPPPLQPPDWIRSRIRRLFLVSLGVPVDLDEILPASKQKKLVLPSLHRMGSNASLATSADEPSSVTKLKQSDANASSTSVDSPGGGGTSSAKQRKGATAEPTLDLVAAKQLCTTTDQALDGMTDQELREHVKKLEALEASAKEMLEYWKKRIDEKIGDREAFEGVIENLVKHARKVRK